MFSVLDLDNVRGDLDRNVDAPRLLNLHRVRITPADAASVAKASGIPITQIRLRERFNRTVFELFDRNGQPLGAVDATSGEFIPRISEAEAKAAALADFAPKVTVASIDFLEGQPPSEYRNGTMPVYRVILDHPKNPHIYVSPVTGEVLKRRNKVWRLFDFFWMLHIMDYRARESFNHWLLTTMSLLAILTSSSGLVLWCWRLPRSKNSTSGAVRMG